MSTAPASQTATLLLPDGSRHPLGQNCSIGRAATGNDLILDSGVVDSTVSRWHALVHRQGNLGYWLVDLGSTFGTYHNDHTVTHPTYLNNEDHIRIGNHTMVFRCPMREIHNHSGGKTTGSTVQYAGSRSLWILVADLVGFTSYSREHSPTEVTKQVSAWFTRCLHLVDRSGGRIDKFLGDGFLAIWKDSPTAARNVRNSIEELHELSNQGCPKFRMAIHKGEVARTRVVKGGEFELLGDDLNRVFRMEELAASLEISCMISKRVHRLLDMKGTRPAGSHPLKGFEGSFELFDWDPERTAPES